MIVAFLLACSDGGDSAAVDDAGQCGPDTGGTSVECDLDACAANCTSVDDGVACCFASHGYGLEAPWVDSLAEACPTCDPTLYISAESALCVAQVRGLSIGGGNCWSDFMYAGGEPYWSVGNQYESDPYCGSRLSIDALSGDLRGQGSWCAR